MQSLSLSRSTESNAVLRNTYMLLSITLLWSALTAFAGLHVQLGTLAYIGLMVAGFAALFATQAFRNSALGLVFIFLFTGLEGFTLGPVLNRYLSMPGGATTVTLAAGLTGAVFLSLSAYAMVTRKNFDFLGGILFAGLIVLLLASLAGLFFHIPALQLTVAAVGVLIFSGFVLFDTSRIVNGGETSYISATVALYLTILNLFLSILRLVDAARR